MRVTHVVNDLTTGGAQTLIDGLADGMRDHLDTSLVVLSSSGPLSDRLQSSCDSVVYLNFSRSSYRLDKLISNVAAAIRGSEPAVVHSHLLQSDLAVALSRLPSHIARVSTVHTTGMTTADSVRSRLLGRAMGRMSGRFDAVVACGDTAADYMRRQGYDGSRSAIINNGVAVGSFRQPRARRGQLLSLSRWHPMKDHKLLFAGLAAARRAGHDYSLTCAGSGVDCENTELTDLVRFYGLESSVRLLGPVRDVNALFDQADALVISSEYGEAWPMAGLEALSSGLPVITTNVGDSARLAVEGWMVVAPGDVQGLASALSTLATVGSGEYENLSAGAWKIATDKFSIAETSRRYFELYQDVSMKRNGVGK
jgi:glycosyltransferase involved in cell wall biosynthesis